MGVAGASFQRVPPQQGETEAGHALEAFVGRGHQPVEGQFARIHRQRAEGTHRVHEQPPFLAPDHLGDGLQGIEDAGGRLAVDHRDVRDVRIDRQHRLDPLGRRRQVVAHVQRHELAAQVFENAGHALAVSAVHQPQRLAVPRQQSGQSRFHGVGSAALQGHANVGVFGVSDRK